MVNPYSVLGISPAASGEEVTTAYRTLAHAAHPDRHGGAPEATARMVALNAAYDALKTNEGRARVDAALAAETPRPADVDKLAAELRIASRFQSGLTKLFFNTDEKLTKTVQLYGVF